MALISRDVFAREEIHRETIPRSQTIAGGGSLSCQWCGGLNGKRSLYRYRVEHDSGRSSPIRGVFCSKACLHCYYS